MSREPLRAPAGDSAHGRHLLPEAMDGRDARRPLFAGGRRDRAEVRGGVAAGLSGAAAEGDSVGRG